MEKMKDDGGPAFPAEDPKNFYLGMSLRDWFAGQALNGILGNPHFRNNDMSLSDEESIAASAYFMADVMLRERSKE